LILLSMQAKQRSLDERVDTLNEKCEDLQRELLEREKLEADFHNQLHQVTHEKEKLQTQFTQHELCLEAHREKRTLELQVGELKHSVAELKEHIRSLREREKLLVAFPDLTPLAHAQPQSNVVLDMKQQLQANSIRIEVLDQENVTLQQSLFKLKERARQNATRVGHFQCSKNRKGNNVQLPRGPANSPPVTPPQHKVHSCSKTCQQAQCFSAPSL
uniref:Uncharacterized protein n=1 Tax=Salarias fasciatus TaxID=181472 RepID=A0A672JKU6_SALFA